MLAYCDSYEFTFQSETTQPKEAVDVGDIQVDIPLSDKQSSDKGKTGTTLTERRTTDHSSTSKTPSMPPIEKTGVSSKLSEGQKSSIEVDLKCMFENPAEFSSYLHVAYLQYMLHATMF